MAERKSYDSAYKYLFSSRVVFHQFLTRFVDEDFVRGLAVEDVELVDKTFVSDELLDRNRYDYGRAARTAQAVQSLDQSDVPWFA